MKMIRYLLADRFGFSWDTIKNTPAHFVRQYIEDIERAKNHFKGLNKGDAKKYAHSVRSSGLPVN
jgi:chloramphenicol O-acetyltransferase